MSENPYAKDLELVEDVSIEQLKQLTLRLKEKKAELEAAKKTVSILQEERREIEQEYLQLLEASELDNFKCEHGMVYTSEIETVRTPQTIEDKKLLFEHLKSLPTRTEGVTDDAFFEYATINSQSLNSLYKQQKEIAFEKGDYSFSMPGIGEPSTHTRLGFRKA